MKISGYTGLFGILLSTTLITHFVAREQFGLLILLFSIAFICYGLVLVSASRIRLRHAILIAVFCRIIIVFAFPALSDDIYRFLWDGLLVVNKLNPLAYTPEMLQANGLPEYLSQSLYDKLNSQQYYTVYPPFAQMIFTIGAWFSGGDIYRFNLILKVFFVLSEVITFTFLYKCMSMLDMNKKNLLYYALNPLIIVELTGNLHFEVFLLMFFMIAVYFLLKQRISTASVYLAFSVLSKMVSLIFIPFLLPYLKLSKWLYFTLICMLLVILLFVPLIADSHLAHFTNSLDLYFRKFEFNASIYYLMRYIGIQWKGYNLIHYIGPSLSIISFILILALSWYAATGRFRDMMKRFAWALLIYLLLSTTVHPWYLSLLILITCFTGFRFPLIWSFVVLLSYGTYRYEGFEESTVLLVVQYAGLAVAALYDLKILKWPIKPISEINYRIYNSQRKA